VRRVERRLFKLNDAIGDLRAEEARVAEELSMLEHIDDDAQRDAAIGGPFDRKDARMTESDVARTRATLERLRLEIGRTEHTRDQLLERLAEG